MVLYLIYWICGNQTILIIVYSIVCRFHQFLKDDEDVRFCEDMGLGEAHQIYFRGVRGRKISDLVKYDGDLIYRIKPEHIIIIFS